jgi:hypothetical protein
MTFAMRICASSAADIRPLLCSIEVCQSYTCVMGAGIGFTL